MKRYTPENGEPPIHAWYPAVQNNAYTVETVLKAEDLKINDVYIADPESAPRFEPIYAYPKKKTKPNEGPLTVVMGAIMYSCLRF